MKDNRPCMIHFDLFLFSKIIPKPIIDISLNKNNTINIEKKERFL